MPSLIDLMLEGREIQQHSPWPRAMVDAAVWNFAANELAQGRWNLLGLWGEPSTVHMAIMDEHTAEIAIVSLDCPDRSYPSVGQHHPPALRLERTIRDLFGLAAEGSARSTPLARSQSLGHALSVGRSHRRLVARRRPIAFCRWRAMGCTRLRLVPCMQGLLSLGTSGLRRAGRPWFGWKNGWDIPTRVLRGS